MKFKSDIDLTYMGYLHNMWYADDRTEEQHIAPMLEQLRKFFAFQPSLLPSFFVLDYSSKNYLVFSDSIKSIIGYDARDFLDHRGLYLTIDIAQKDHLASLDKKVFPKTLDFLRSIPARDQQNYIISYNNQFKNKVGQLVSVLQKAIYISSEKTGLPLFCVGMVTDITGFKRDRTVVHTIERVDSKDHSSHVIERNCYYLFDEEAMLTKQEINVVKWMADGLSTKMIAHKLWLSENTIANHRKNMLKKTNTKNVAQLIAFVIRNNII
jgi:DNA-binding CsgD family transcriptional regulator